MLMQNAPDVHETKKCVQKRVRNHENYLLIAVKRKRRENTGFMYIVRVKKNKCLTPPFVLYLKLHDAQQEVKVRAIDAHTETDLQS